MTIAVFTLSLLGAMALGMPIAFALIVCGVALMYQLDIFDSLNLILFFLTHLFDAGGHFLFSLELFANFSFQRVARLNLRRQ